MNPELDRPTRNGEVSLRNALLGLGRYALELCLGLGLLVAFPAAAEAGPGALEVRGKLRAQLDGSKSASLRLDVAGLPFGAVALSGARETSGGHFLGKTAFGKASVRALFHFVPERAGSDAGTWLLALKLNAKRLSDLAPLCRSTIVDQLDLATPILVFALGRVAAPRRRLDAEARAFYGAYATRSLELAKGVNLVTVATPRRGTLVAKALGLLGLGKLQLNLRGVVLKDFKLGELKEARDKGQLKQALQRDTELRAEIPRFRLPGLPQAFRTSSAFVAVTGEPGVGVGFSMTLGTGRARRTFDCAVSVRKIPAKAEGKKTPNETKQPTGVEQAEPSITELTVVAGARGRWERAFGIPGFNLNEVRLLMSVDSSQQLGFGLRARMDLGSTRAMIAGKLELHAVTGAATGGMFAFRINSLGSGDLIHFANAVAAARPGKRKRKVKLGGIPAFRLVDVSGRYAPLGGDHRLGIKSGIALKGKLFALKRQLLAVDAVVDQTTLVPTIRVWGRASRVDLGAIALERAAVDIKLGATLNPFFRVKGGSRILGASKHLDVDVDRKKLRFELTDKVAGVYEARWMASSPSRGKPSWDLDVRFKNHFHKTLERDVSRKALAWAQGVSSEFAQAERNLKRAQDGLSALDRKIAAARKEVRASRAKHQRNLTRAIQEVEKLDRAIAARRKEVDARHAGLRKVVNASRKKRDAARKKWERARARRKKAKGFKKAKARAAETGAFSKKVAAEAEYKVISGKLTKALTKVDAKLASLHTARATAVGTLKATRAAHRALIKVGPVDADPRVAGLITERKTAEGVLITARAVVKATGAVAVAGLKVTAWAAKNHGRVIKLHAARFSAKLAAYRRGSKVTLRVRVSTLGRKPVTHKVVVRPADLRGGRVFALVWRAIRPTLSKQEGRKHEKAQKRARKKAKQNARQKKRARKKARR